MGAEFIDYLIADGTVVPRAQRAHYVEKIAYLPDSFLPFDSSYAIAPNDFTRAKSWDCRPEPSCSAVSTTVTRFCQKSSMAG